MLSMAKPPCRALRDMPPSISTLPLVNERVQHVHRCRTHDSRNGAP